MKVVYTDIHLESPIASHTLAEFDEAIVNDLFRGNDVYLIGDIWDFAGCAKDRIPALMRDYKYWHAMVKEVNENQKYTGKLYIIDGNHERMTVERESIIDEDDEYDHGDYVTWPYRRVVKYRKKKHSAGFFKRRVTIPLIEWGEKFFSNDKVTKRMKKNALRFLEVSGCKRLSIGHRHPSKRIDTDLGGGKTLIVLPRGRNEL